MGRDEINSAIFFGVVMAVFSLCEGVNGTKDSWYSCALCGLPMSFFLPHDKVREEAFGIVAFKMNDTKDAEPLRPRYCRRCAKPTHVEWN